MICCATCLLSSADSENTPPEDGRDANPTSLRIGGGGGGYELSINSRNNLKSTKQKGHQTSAFY